MVPLPCCCRCSVVQAPLSPVQIVMYEKVKFAACFGLLLTVSSQPAVAHVQSVLRGVPDLEVQQSPCKTRTETHSDKTRIGTHTVTHIVTRIATSYTGFQTWKSNRAHVRHA